MRKTVQRSFIRVERTAIFVLLTGAILAGCKYRSVDKTPPPGALEHSISSDGEFVATMFDDRLVFLHEGEKEFEVTPEDFEGMNFSGGGVVIFKKGGSRKIFTFQDYDAKVAKRIVQRLADGDWGDSEQESAEEFDPEDADYAENEEEESEE